jgi:hypothetical protein
LLIGNVEFFALATAPVNADGSATAATTAVPPMRSSRRVTKLLSIEFPWFIYFLLPPLLSATTPEPQPVSPTAH